MIPPILNWLVVALMGGIMIRLAVSYADSVRSVGESYTKAVSSMSASKNVRDAWNVRPIVDDRGIKPRVTWADLRVGSPCNTTQYAQGSMVRGYWRGKYVGKFPGYRRD